MEPEDTSSSLLAPLASEYLPGPGDRERLRAAIRARLANETSASDDVPTEAHKSWWPTRAGVHGAGLLAIIGGIGVFSIWSDRNPVATAEVAVDLPMPVADGETAPADRADTLSAAEPASPYGVPFGPPPPLVDSVAVNALPSAKHAGPVRGTPTPSAAIDDGDALRKETALLVAARHALRDGDGARAISVLDEHARDFPRGFLANERAVERIHPLCLLGRTEDARSEARPFLESQSSHPLARHVKSTCAVDGRR